MENTLETIIKKIEAYSKEHNMQHRFVGSVSYGGLVNEKTTYTIDIKNKKIYLRNHNFITTMRNDHTYRDIDVILFCKDKKRIYLFKKFLNELKKEYTNKNIAFPLISVEAAIYPEFGKRNILLQFVSALEVDTQNQLYFTFDTIKQKIDWKSVEPWTVLLENGLLLTTRNPIADYFAYHLRTPSGIKPKDEYKVSLLKQLSDKVIKKGKTYNIDYLSENYYGNWITFIEKLKKTTHSSILFKREFSKYYWLTIGTYLAHGKGTGKLFLSLQNQFTGIKQ